MLKRGIIFSGKKGEAEPFPERPGGNAIKERARGRNNVIKNRGKDCTGVKKFTSTTQRESLRKDHHWVAQRAILLRKYQR